jgi:DNA mismatch repair protein MutL
MSVIHILPDRVANQIAAGEVVERPASVAKELLENSLDAGAGRIEVEVEAGGKRLVRVTDDGSGMVRDDALLAFERHATSKIRQADDLLEVSTLGFRGEALPSIAAVSRLVLETRHASERSGTRVEIAGGKLRDVREIAWPAGTRVEARDLFFNTPARRKFLKSESTELGHIASLLTHYALAHPEKSFRLASMTHEVMNAPPAPDARTRVYQLLGAQALDQLIEIKAVERRLPVVASFEEADSEPLEAAGLVRLSGFVSRPEVQRLNRNGVYFFVNRRLVRDRLILHALAEAYRNILPPRMFPVALVFLEMPLQEVDVNVHPSKTEVRFRHSSFVHDFTRDAVRQAVIAARPVAAFPLKRDVREPVAEDIEALERLAEESPAQGWTRGASQGEARAVRAGSSAKPWAGPGPRVPSALSGSTSLSPERISLPGDRGDFTLSSPRPQPAAGRLAFEAAPAGSEQPCPTEDRDGRAAFGTESSPESAVRRPNLPHERTADIARGASGAEFPSDLHALGQVEASYIVATNAAGLWIVDQHAAHERILFERHLRQVRAHEVEAQRLLLPIIVELKPQQQVAFSEIADELVANGFEVEPFGQRTVAVKTAPAEVRPEDVERLLIEILDEAGREARSLSLEILRARITASVACHAAIKVHMALDRPKMEWLLAELGGAESPMTCPHGRPVILRYSIQDLERAFRRT